MHASFVRLTRVNPLQSGLTMSPPSLASAAAALIAVIFLVAGPAEVSAYGNLSYPSTTFVVPVLDRNLTIPWSVYLGGAIYGIMYAFAATGTAITGRKKRSADEKISDHITDYYGQIGTCASASSSYSERLGKHSWSV